MTVDLRHADSARVLPTLADSSVSAIVTDPPYGLGFMGQKWDTYANETGRAPSRKHSFDHVGGNHNPSNSADAARTRRVESQRFGEWCEGWTAECLRVLKPGGHLLAFGGTRTSHRLAVAIEDAGFEIRDTITWLYGSGFPKSRDVSKAIDKAAGAEREVVGTKEYPGREGWTNGDGAEGGTGTYELGMERRHLAQAVTAPATDAARQWQGFGTALKPASEPIIVARKPLSGTVAACVLEHGTGALNVDGCRVATDVPRPARVPSGRTGDVFGAGLEGGTKAPDTTAGRWPANVVLTHAPDCADPCAPGCPVAELDAQSGTTMSSAAPRRNTAAAHNATASMGKSSADWTTTGHADQGGASRFFPTFRYQAKAPASERPKIDGQGWPTVKPLALMRWLVRLVTPPGGLVLDLFAGTGPTLQAAELEGLDSLGIEQDEFAYRLACQRLGIGPPAVKHEGQASFLDLLAEGTAS